MTRWPRCGQARRSWWTSASPAPVVHQHSSTGAYVDLVHARQELEEVLGRRAAVLIALVQVLRRARPHELILDGRPRRLWLYFAGNCGYEPPGTAPAYRPDLSDGTSTSASWTPTPWPGRA